MNRDLDIVLFGATGFTGRLVADFLGRRAGGLRWAIAGRDAARLEQVRAQVGGGPAVLGVDARDDAAVADLARRARVVCTTVGPYARLGGPLVAACAAAGTDYCDITGEIPFMRRTIDAHHAQAAACGARIVHGCGFDSIPSDLGVLLLHDRVRGTGAALAAAHGRVVRIGGGLGGGTVATMLALGEDAARDPAVRRVLLDPYALDPAGSPRGPDGPDRLAPRRDADGRWHGAFVMASINTRVVRRSNALLGGAYGPAFRYDEAVQTGRGFRGLAGAALLGGMVAGLGLAAGTAVGRRLLRAVLPAPGTGPGAARRAAGHFTFEVRGETAGGARPGVTVRSTLDPGYGATALMLGESALMLATGPRGPGGVLTPAVALGLPLVDRLRAAGIAFD